MGERLRRELQREVPRRVAQPGDLLHAEGDTNTDRDVAQEVQHDPTSQLA